MIYLFDQNHIRWCLVFFHNVENAFGKVVVTFFVKVVVTFFVKTQEIQCTSNYVAQCGMKDVIYPFAFSFFAVFQIHLYIFNERPPQFHVKMSLNRLKNKSWNRIICIDQLHWLIPVKKMWYPTIVYCERIRN